MQSKDNTYSYWLIMSDRDILVTTRSYWMYVSPAMHKVKDQTRKF